MLTIQKRIAVVSARLRGMTYEQVRQDFERRFRKPGPTRQAIRDLVNKFQRTGNSADEKCSGTSTTTPHNSASHTGCHHTESHRFYQKNEQGALGFTKNCMAYLTLYLEETPLSHPDTAPA
ncbi:hypothetical protein ANN_12205 [Periplaneta americana]|uniref:DUF4817 domain-containing protein n=1 Tax=Periplaneta americana TaxID=6978 RepID=A0ABQ8TG62_PERAM|nr:hypothetical protein ANN_12205 [Periplaneta americana]